MVALVYLREHTTLAKIAAGFGASEPTAHTCTDPDGRLLWLSPAPPGRAHGLTTCPHPPSSASASGQGAPILVADLAIRAAARE